MTTAETISQPAVPVESKIFVSRVEKKALLDVPVFETHKRSKNWMAIITCDPTSPGGFARKFCDRGNGVYYYIVDPTIVGKAIEFGADYYTSSGSKREIRYYGVVISLTETEIRIRKSDTGRDACKITDVQVEPDRAALIAEREIILSRLAEINLIVGGDD